MLPSKMNPFIFEFGVFKVGWYGMMYVVAFVVCYLVSLYRIKHEDTPYSSEFVQDFLVWSAFGLIIGARIGYVVFYNFSYFSANPLEAMLPFQFGSDGLRYTGIAGMSYHGGLIGVFLTSLWFLRKHKVGFIEFADFIIPCAPLGYIFGRLGNFINVELYGRATEVPWGMYFPSDSSGLLRHPSQLYEAGLEGALIFAILWSIRNLKAFKGLMLPLYLIGYASARFVVEFFREPDAHLGFVVGTLSMGQLLSIAMVVAGVLTILIVLRARHISGV